MRLGRGAWALGAAALLAASLAAAMLLRKPPQHVFTPLAAVARAASAAADALDGLERIAPALPAPAVTFEDGDGKPHSLRDFLGKPVLLNVWATWCGPCVEELPSLAALAPAAAKAGIVVLPLSVDRGGIGRVRAFYASHGVDGLPVWNDPGGGADDALGLRGVPTTFLIDASGREVAKLEGAADWDSPSVLPALQRLLR